VKQLGEILLEEGLVSEAQLLAALDETASNGSSLGRTLVEFGVLTEGQLVQALAAQVGMRFVDLDEFAVDRMAVSLVPAAMCRRYTVLPIALESGQVILATADPGNVMAVDDVRSITGRVVIPVVATYDNVLRAIDRFCRADGEMEDLTTAFEESMPEQETDLSRIGDSVDDDAPIVRFVNLLVTQAITDRASDIHIEPASTTCASATASTACCTRRSAPRRTSRAA
jgi:type IV pilus assembly protein PilB